MTTPLTKAAIHEYFRLQFTLNLSLMWRGNVFDTTPRIPQNDYDTTHDFTTITVSAKQKRAIYCTYGLLRLEMKHLAAMLYANCKSHEPVLNSLLHGLSLKETEFSSRKNRQEKKKKRGRRRSRRASLLIKLIAVFTLNE